MGIIYGKKVPKNNDIVIQEVKLGTRKLRLLDYTATRNKVLISPRKLDLEMSMFRKEIRDKFLDGLVATFNLDTTCIANYWWDLVYDIKPMSDTSNAYITINNKKHITPNFTFETPIPIAMGMFTKVELPPCTVRGVTLLEKTLIPMKSYENDVLEVRNGIITFKNLDQKSR
jgi:hypothetical protein